MENNLINLTKDENGNIAVSGRELHKGLKIETPYKQWIDRMIGYGFEENADYVVTSEKVHTQKSVRAYEQKNHVMTLDMAKEIAMIQRSKIGQKIRGYFISVEKEYRQIVEQPKDSYMIDNPVERAKRWIEEQEEKENLLIENNMKSQKIGELEPKAEYYDLILQNKGLVNIGQIAKDYGMTAQKMNKTLSDLKIQYRQSGQWLLYRQYHDKGYTHSDTQEYTRTNGKTGVNMHTKWTQKGRIFLYNTLKEEGIIPVIEQDFEELNLGGNE